MEMFPDNIPFEYLFLEDSGQYSELEDLGELVGPDREIHILESSEEEDGGYEIVLWDEDEGISETEYELTTVEIRYHGWVEVKFEEDWGAEEEIYVVTQDVTIVLDETTDEMWLEYVVR